ncbi:phosphotransferase [Paenibacillus sp. PK3_47]|uniref:phosphotransferase enzyme family protein n=1 Tax=Paenibacillus sp. PK3_47 TaxID=2072642 RepID=UPI003183B347
MEYGNALWDNVKNLPYRYCHGDLNRGNILQTPDGEMVLLDFDTSCSAFAIFDIMMVCNCTDYFSYNDDGYKETKGIYERFLTGYSDYHSLSENEMSAFYDFVAIMHYQLQATIIEIHGLDCVDEKFIDHQLEWLLKWREQCQRECS